MNTIETDRAGEDKAIRAALFRFVLLIALLILAFRRDVISILMTACEFSDWSHALVLPIVVLAYLRFRGSELRELEMSPSAWGLLLVLGGLFVWFAAMTLGLFAYLRVLAFWTAIGGVVLLAAGRSVLRLCIPPLLMVATCLPLEERSMDRFTIPIQVISVRTAATVVDRLVGDEVWTDGGEMLRRTAGENSRVGRGEHRFGFRMSQAGALIGLLVVFSRKRPVWQLVILAISFGPLLFCVNVARIIVWSMSAWSRGNSVVDVVPQNLSAGASILMTFLVFGIVVWLLDKVSCLGGLFYVEEEETDDEANYEKPPSHTEASR
ncbi:MAG: exosortase/archaeosortase family protein [Phycisphaerales bacterium]|nr:exosortase/archaeosortase family protein [Phycisphaerales bacterium]